MNNCFWAAAIGTLLVFAGCSKSGITGEKFNEEDPDDVITGAQPCIDGKSKGIYNCQGIDLLAQMSPKSLLGERLNDIWGWTDPETSKEYALVGLSDGVSFVDISTPEDPVLVGKLRESIASKRKVHNFSKATKTGQLQHDDQEGKSHWRDFKVFHNYLFVVSDDQPHGMQVFDLTRLRSVADPPEIFNHDFLYEEFANAHNIAINEETGFAYVVGSNTYGGGLHIIDIQDPLNPSFAGSHRDETVGISSSGYVHDTQCVIYAGSDSDYQGDEICFNSSETHLAIANVTDKTSTYTISKSFFEGRQYIHQGWLTEDHRYFLVDDELDEMRNNHATRTYIWDLNDLDSPELAGSYDAPHGSIDHNQYVKGNRLYQANYSSGLRILNLDGIGSGILEEVAYFDTFPQDNDIKFDGAWSNYPYFESGVVIVSDISNGLFILEEKPE